MTRARYRSWVPLIAGTAALVVLCVAGCRNQESRNDAPAHPVAAPSMPGQGHPPYYHGLIEEYQNVLAEDPHNLAAIIALGNAYSDAKHCKEAIHYYEQALKLAPANADVITDMGTCYRNLGRPDRAIHEYHRALDIEPAHQNALFNLGVVYGYDLKDYAAAIRAWEQLLHVSPKHPQAEYLQASIARFKKSMKKKAS